MNFFVYFFLFSKRVLTSSKSVVVRCPNGRLLGYDGVLRDAFNCSAKSDEPQGLGTRFCVDGVKLIFILLFSIFQTKNTFLFQ